MNFTHLKSRTLLALAACAALVTPAAKAATSAPGDLFLGVHATGGTGATEDYIVNIGQAPLTGSSTVTVKDISADLALIYGASWATRTDLFWGIVGTTGSFSAVGDEPAKTLYASRARASLGVPNTPWARQSDAAQGSATNKINGLASAFNTSLSTGLTTVNAVRQAKTATNSWVSYQPGGTVANSGPLPGISFAFFNPSIEASVATTPTQLDTVVDLFRMRPATDSAPPGTAGDRIGSYSLTGGVLSFTPGSALFVISPSSTSVMESLGAISVTVKRTGNVAVGTSVDLSTVDGSAVAGTDFVGITNQQILFDDGSDTATTVVTILNRPGLHADRTFTVALSNPGGGTALSTSSTISVTITESESAFAFSGAATSTREDLGKATLTINRTGVTNVAATVNVTTADGTAVAGTDFTGLTNFPVAFAANELVKTVDINVTNRPGIRANRAFTVSLVSPNSLVTTVSPSTATVTITEADTLASMTGPSSSATPYIKAIDPSFFITSIMTVGDSFGGYQMAGIPDGLGAFDNNDGTFTLLMHHELGNTVGSTRAHGAIGAFVSSWVINKTTLQVQSGADLMQQVYGWNSGTQTQNPTFGTFTFNRFCSADLPPVSAFYNAASGLGTQQRLFMGGEEGGATGWALAHVATGPDKGKSYILGKFNRATNGSGSSDVGAWETLCANPYPQNQTIVVGNNDGGTGIMNGSVSVYVGTKTNSGTEADKAGLSNGTLYFVNVTGNPVEVTNATTRATGITNGTAFTLSTTASTFFSRPEDGAWNPLNLNQYYFVTTDRLDQVADGIGSQIGRTRLWRLTFTDITNPTLGGTIDMLIEGGGTTPVANDANMFDNLAVSADGKMMLEEDVGGAPHNGKIWFFNPASNTLTKATMSDPARFGDIASGAAVPATLPFNNDEENSGIIDVTALLGGNALTGDRLWLNVTQAHYTLANPLVEGGQLQLIRQSAPLSTPFLGVASGDTDSSSVTLWTRYNNATAATVTAQVSTNSAFTGSPVAVTSGAPSAANDWTSKVRVTGLLPNTTYFYRFIVAATGELSGTGMFKTAPASTTSAAVHFAFSGDNDGLMRPYPVASSIPALGLDFYINLGDVIYENASNVAGNNSASWLNSPSVTLSNSALNLNGEPVAGTTFATAAQLKADYEKKYRENFLPVNIGGQYSLKDLYSAQANYTTWDNHELGNRKYIDGGAPAGGSVGGPTGNDMPTGRGVDARNNGTGNVGNVNDVNTSTTDFMNRSVGWQTLRDVFLNAMPIADRGTISAPSDNRTNGTKQIYNSNQWGKNVLYINTDTRSYRDIRLKTATGSADETTAPRANNPARTMLGATQLAWVKQQLLTAQIAGVTWKFVSVSDPIDQIGAIGNSSADGGKSWIGGYRAERNDLLKYIADNHIINVVFLSTDDHTNRINELTYSPTNTENQATYVKVPYCFSIVCGPLGATGPDTITNHSFSNIKSLADAFALSQTSVGIEGLGLMGYPGIKNITREGDATAGTSPQPVDFYSPDTFNYTVLDVSADGQTLTVSSRGINSFAQNAGLEYDGTTNPVRTVFSFQVDAPAPINNWRQFYLGTVNNSGNAADGADFDGDGISNLMEYALGINPAIATGANGLSALPAPSSSSANPLLDGRLSLSFTVDQPTPADITYTVRVSDDLGIWTNLAHKVGTGAWVWDGGGTPRIVTTVAGGRINVQVGDIVANDAAHPRRFMDLQVSNP